MHDQERRVALITGAGRMNGLGRALAVRFAKDGFDVAIIDLHPSKLPELEDEIAVGWRGLESVVQEIMSLGRRGHAINADITDAAQVKRAVDDTVKALGRIDVLVNNARAALGRDFASVVELDPNEWDRVMSVNARAVFLCSQAVARHMIARAEGGKIINVSSSASKKGRAGVAAYSSSKFAVNGFTQSLALELAQHKINVNAVCPGTIESGRFNLREKEAAEAAGVSLKEIQRARFAEKGKQIPLGRVATFEDVTNMVAFLASPQAEYITGQAINVDGGAQFH